MFEEIQEFNKKFVAEERYKAYITDKHPKKKMAILTCMDTRLTELLPAALGIKNGDVKLIKNAGGVISDPFGSEVRSLLVAIFELGVEKIMVIGHTDCGVGNLDSQVLLGHIKKKGIPQETLEQMTSCGIDFEKWLRGFDDVESAVRETVNLLRKHPLIPKDIAIGGFVIDSVTGELREVP